MHSKIGEALQWNNDGGGGDDSDPFRKAIEGDLIPQCTPLLGVPDSDTKDGLAFTELPTALIFLTAWSPVGLWLTSYYLGRPTTTGLRAPPAPVPVGW